jgi:hypothetical protein
MAGTLELIRRIIRQQSVLVGQPINNLYGAVAGSATQLSAQVDSQWHVARIPGTRLLSLQEFYSAFLGDPQRVNTVIPAVDGFAAILAADPSNFLLAGTVDLATPLTLSTTVLASGTGAWAVYVDDVLVRQGASDAAFTISLGVGTHSIEALTTSNAFALGLPKTVRVYVDQGHLDIPVWAEVEPGYADPSAGTPSVNLTWYNNVKVGGWLLLRREITSLVTVS